MSRWQTLDLQDLFARRDLMREQTTSANVGAFVSPMGPVLRSPDLVGQDFPKDIPPEYLEMLGLKPIRTRR